jgi:hypothetical protein
MPHVQEGYALYCPMQESKTLCCLMGRRKAHCVAHVNNQDYVLPPVQERTTLIYVTPVCKREMHWLPLVLGSNALCCSCVQESGALCCPCVQESNVLCCHCVQESDALCCPCVQKSNAPV